MSALERARVFTSRYVIMLLVTLFAFADLAPPLIGLFQRGRVRNMVGSVRGTGSIAQTHASSSLQTLSWISVIAMASLLIVVAVAQRHPLRGLRSTTDIVGMILFTGFMATALGASYLGDGGTVAIRSLLIVSVTAGAIFLHRAAVPAGWALGHLSAWFCVATLAFACFQLAWTVPATTDSKAFIGHDLLAGSLSQCNILGIVAVMSIPLIVDSYRGVRMPLYVSAATVVILLTGSRTAMVALAALGGASLVRLVLRRTKLLAFSAAVMAVILVAATVALPFLIRNGGTFTGRGNIWHASRLFWQDNLAFGQGPYFYADQSIRKILHQVLLHGHNTFVSFQTEIGLVGVLGFLVLIAYLIWKTAAIYETQPAPFYFLITLLALGLLETPLRLDTVNDQGWVVWLGLIIVCCMPGADRTRTRGWRRR